MVSASALSRFFFPVCARAGTLGGTRSKNTTRWSILFQARSRRFLRSACTVHSNNYRRIMLIITPDRMLSGNCYTRQGVKQKCVNLRAHGSCQTRNSLDFLF
ncbi:hypothetical protein C8R43DRAFT_992712 [Mycena crocata]|nr:hypothetical protein C8R43DRAFT_992712 [Mycena crocata]